MEEEELLGESLALKELLDDPAVTILAKCFKNAIAEDVSQLDLADLTESTFDGYAPIQITDVDVFPGEDDAFGEGVSPPLEWTAGEDITPENVHGIYLTIQREGEAARLWQVFRFAEPFCMDVNERVLNRQVRFYSYDENTV